VLPLCEVENCLQIFKNKICELISDVVFWLVGTGIDPDPLEAAKLFRDLADDGHPYAQVL
jgi:hypothetical protein